jgi:hypothetical protein
LRLKQIPGYVFDLQIKKGILIPNNRNLTLGDYDFDYYMPLDGDHEFSEKDIARMLNHDLDIVFGAYESRERPGYATASESGGFDIPMSASGLKKVIFSGLGFGLIKRNVFDKIEKPPFYFPRMQGQMVGEDVAFCLDAINAGFEIFVDCDCKIKHILTSKGDSSMEAKKVNEIKNDIVKRQFAFYKAKEALEAASKGLMEICEFALQNIKSDTESPSREYPDVEKNDRNDIA